LVAPLIEPATGAGQPGGGFSVGGGWVEVCAEKVIVLGLTVPEVPLTSAMLTVQVEPAAPIVKGMVCDPPAFSMMPPWLEAQRAQIARMLPPLHPALAEAEGA
jgi:hypothetical protein